MSGHSKWATTKHKKAQIDKTRGKLFAKLIRQVEVAAREGGGDLEGNATLRNMYQKARDASVPLDTIDRAIKRGTGELEGVRYEPVAYEGYAQCGVAVYVECLTDNRNRTGAEIKNIFSKSGGSLAEPGAVAWQFRRVGLVSVPATIDEDEITMAGAEAGADDVIRVGDEWHIICPPELASSVKKAVEDGGYAINGFEITMVPTSNVAIDDEGDLRKIIRTIDMLEDHDDVQNVFSNFDTTDEIMDKVLVD